jgi:hypothetical protein
MIQLSKLIKMIRSPNNKNAGVFLYKDDVNLDMHFLLSCSAARSQFESPLKDLSIKLYIALDESSSVYRFYGGSDSQLKLDLVTLKIIPKTPEELYFEKY